MNPLTILLTDEDQDLLQIMRLMLEEEGHRVVTTRDAGSALIHLQKEAFDVVITEVLLTGADGIDVIRAATALKRAPRVIAMSVGGPHLLPSYCLDLALAFGAAASLVKPFSRQELLATIGRGGRRTAPVERSITSARSPYGTKKTFA